MTKTYLLLVIAIAAEVLATSMLRHSEQFTKPLPSALVIVGYGVAFYLLSIVVKSMPTGIAYALWSGFGVVIVAGIGWMSGQKLDLAAVTGIGLIVAGVLVINLFSGTGSH